MRPPQKHTPIPYKKIFTTSILISFFIFIGIFAYNKTKAIWTGTPLVIHSPTEGEVVREDMVEVSGNARRSIILTINGDQTLINKDGDFSTLLPVFEGINTMTVIAEDKFQNRKEKEITFIGSLN